MPWHDAHKGAGVHAAAIDFLGRHADVAAELGWTALQLLRVHPTHGVIRSDFSGAMLLSGDKVSSVEEGAIRFGNTTYYRNSPGKPKGAVPVWAVKQ